MTSTSGQSRYFITEQLSGTCIDSAANVICASHPALQVFQKLSSRCCRLPVCWYYLWRSYVSWMNHKMELAKSLQKPKQKRFSGRVLLILG